MRLPVRPWREWTVRTRMVVSIAALAAIGLLVVGVSSVFLLRNSLVDRVDRQLSGQVRFLSSGVIPEEPPGGGAPGFGAGRGFGPASEVRMYSADGTLLYPTDATARSEQPDLGTFTEISGHVDEGPYTVDGADGDWRVEVVPFRSGTGFGVAAVSLREVDGVQTNLLVIDGIVAAIVLAGIGIAAASVVRAGMRPLTRMEEAAAEIAGGDLSRRVEDADPHTESGRLGMALNTMLVRIETAMAERTASERRLRQFLADAAHELRTPLTSIQGFAELYRRGGAPEGPELDEAMGAIEAEVGRMRLLVNDLLLLARLDEERPLDQRPVDLLAVAADTVRDAHVRVPTRFVLLGPLGDDEDTFDPVTVPGDEPRLRQVATNLVANALQHTPDDAEVVVRVGRSVAGNGAPAAAAGRRLVPEEPVAVLEVADTGPGMASADAERVFERLFRAEVSRSRRRGGAGLGLSIVSSIVRAHGGRIELWTAPGAGATFRVLLPMGVALSEDGADSKVALS